ncbi:DHA2 family efflux MFS transporter permease subunit [Paramicrobacterium chengjingii]|uniref:DHA2 family efflux MFS transporter permease subunit n=1 Tax=Paramicrobacterium chengjingii TaxID=2769067 RepID=A0ABX6YHZ1_9MICO|nr:DHA2 family efflux MFS transporter permease subunit [Microbacterium chengjingii]QPZ38439.1 DHA2 family efflux MFS transporter permease subunit [Microbacterium chengjingii]
MAEESTPKPVNRNVVLAVLLSGAFVAILNQTLLATALPVFMKDLDVTANTVQWLTTIFMLVNGIMIPITAFLIQRFTTRGLFLTAMGLFTIGTLVCAIAVNFPVLLAGRVVQAAGAGIIMPLMQTILFAIFPREKRGTAMGTFGLVISFAPAIGPSLSGWIIDHFPWQSLFIMMLPIAVIDIIVAFFILKNVTERTFPKLDVLSIILSTVGFGGLLFGFSAAGSAGWASPRVIITLAVGVISLVVFILRQLKLEQPILEFRVFKYPMFTLNTAIGMAVFMVMIGGATILPLYMQNMLGFTALESGVALLPGALVMGIASPFTGRIFDLFGARWLAVIGLTIVTVTTVMFGFLTTDTTFAYIAIVNAVRMLGTAMVMMPVTTAALNELTPLLIPHGTAMNNTMRQISGSIGTAVLITIMTSTALDPKEFGVEGLIHGVNVSFIVAGCLGVASIIMAPFIKDYKRKTLPGTV